MNRFYEEDDATLVDLQCELCVFWNPATPRSCRNYPEKPQAVLNNEQRCPFLRWKDLVDLD